MFSCEAERNLLCEQNSTPPLAWSELKKRVAPWVHRVGETFTYQPWPLLGGSQTNPHAVEKRGCLPGRILKIRCKQPSGMHGREQILSPLTFLKLLFDLGGNLVIIQQCLVLLFSSRDTNYWMLKFISFKNKTQMWTVLEAGVSFQNRVHESFIVCATTDSIYCSWSPEDPEWNNCFVWEWVRTHSRQFYFWR